MVDSHDAVEDRHRHQDASSEIVEASCVLAMVLVVDDDLRIDHADLGCVANLEEWFFVQN